MNKIENKLYTFDDKTSDEVLLMNGFTHINQLIPYVNDLQRENKQLKDNWNKLKEIVKSQSSLKQKCHNESLWFEVDELLNKIQELEGDYNE